MLIGLSDLVRQCFLFSIDQHNVQLNGQPPVSYFIDFVFFSPIIRFNIHYIRHSASSTTSHQLLINISPCKIYGIARPPISFSSPTYISLPDSPSVERAVVGSQHGPMVDKARLLDYATHEVPLPLFGLGHDRACTFCGAPLPHCGQA